MSLEQNDKKIKYLAVLASGLLIWLIWQLVLLNNSYNLSNRPIVIERSQRVGEISQESPTTHPATPKTYSKNFYIAASKTGTKYYYQNCAGLGRIKPENLTFFTSERQAEGAGYTIAKNCQKP